MRGIAIVGDAQLIFVDTPGIFAPKRRLDVAMVTSAWAGAHDADVVCALLDAQRRVDEETQKLFEGLAGLRQPKVLILNKIDLLADKRDLLPLISQFQAMRDFKEVIPISALRKKGLDELLQCVLQALPKAPAHFPEDQITDQPLRFMAAELIREQILMQTREEVPHAVSVMVDQYEEGKTLTRIAATIYCDRNSQKTILVGKGGQMLKKIGTGARIDIEKLVETKVFLELFVKVQPGWRESRQFVAEMDWRKSMI